MFCVEVETWKWFPVIMQLVYILEYITENALKRSSWFSYPLLLETRVTSWLHWFRAPRIMTAGILNLSLTATGKTFIELHFNYSHWPTARCRKHCNGWRGGWLLYKHCIGWRGVVVGLSGWFISTPYCIVPNSKVHNFRGFCNSKGLVEAIFNLQRYSLCYT